MGSLFTLKRFKNQALVFPIRRAIRMTVMDKLVHVFSQQIRFVFIPQRLEAGRIAKIAVSFTINAVNSLYRRIKKQPDLFFVLLKRDFRFLARRHVPIDNIKGQRNDHKNSRAPGRYPSQENHNRHKNSKPKA